MAAAGVPTIEPDTIILAGQTLAAAGSVQGDAALLSPGMTIVTGADGTVGVRLPANAKGKVFGIKNTAGSTLKLWPPTGGAINAAGANNSVSVLTVTSCLVIAVTDLLFETIPTVPS